MCYNINQIKVNFIGFSTKPLITDHHWSFKIQIFYFITKTCHSWNICALNENSIWNEKKKPPKIWIENYYSLVSIRKSVDVLKLLLCIMIIDVRHEQNKYQIEYWKPDLVCTFQCTHNLCYQKNTEYGILFFNRCGVYDFDGKIYNLQ